MTRSLYSSIVVKVGTNVLTTADGDLDRRVIRGLVRQIAALLGRGHEVTLVTSGAMGAGRSLVRPAARHGVVARRQVLAAVGQIRLIETYARHFARADIVCAQVLATKEDFRDRHHYLNMRNCFQALQAERVLPIVNENDVVAVDELMFSDNDELAGLIASMLGADALVILTNVDGVFDGTPGAAGARLVETLPPEKSQWLRLIQPHRSAFGRGGMLTKCTIAQKLSRTGVATHICNGRARNVLLRLCAGEPVGTLCPPSSKPLRGKKRWMAGGVGAARGSVTINEGARTAIVSGRAVASLLPVGIVAIAGDFDRGDIIRILDAEGRDVGLGIASYGAERAREVVGQRGQRALVHYDQLHLVH